MSQENDATPEEVMELFFAYSYILQKSALTEWWALDLTIAQLKVLFTLALEERVTIGKIAENLGIGQPTASHLVDRLVQAGLAERVENPSDRRYTLTRLTLQGKERIHRLRQGRLDHIQSWLTQLDQQDLAALRQGMKALLDTAQATGDQEETALPSKDGKSCS